MSPKNNYAMNIISANNMNKNKAVQLNRQRAMNENINKRSADLQGIQLADKITQKEAQTEITGYLSRLLGIAPENINFGNQLATINQLKNALKVVEKNGGNVVETSNYFDRLLGTIYGSSAVASLPQHSLVGYLSGGAKFSDALRESATKGLAVLDTFGFINRNNPWFKLDPSALDRNGNIKMNSARTAENRGIYGMYQDTAGKVSDYLYKSINGVTIADGVEALRQSEQKGYNTSFLDTLNKQQTLQLLMATYYKNNNVPGDIYQGAVKKITDHLATFYNNCATYKDCINFENDIVHCIRAADASGGQYMNPNRYLALEEDIRELRQLLDKQQKAGASNEGTNEQEQKEKKDVTKSTSAGYVVTHANPNTINTSSTEEKGKKKKK